MPTRKRRTKIVTTLGPATDRPGVLEELIRAGANVVRLNFSHGTFEDHQKRVQMVREASAKLDLPVAIMGDLQGPKIRIGKFKDGPILLKHGDIFVLDADLPLDAGNQEAVGLTYKELPHDVFNLQSPRLKAIASSPPSSSQARCPTIRASTSKVVVCPLRP